jgi:flagellar motor switch protein FliM
MDQTTPRSVLRRKIGAHDGSASPADGPPALLFTALARLAERRFGLALTLRSGSVSELTAAEVIDTLPDQPLLLTLDGPEAAQGLAVLDQGACSALGELAALGSLALRPAPARRPTRTDALMVAELLDAALDDFDGRSAGTDHWRWTSDFRYAAHLADPRPLPLLLEEPGYRLLGLDLAFGPGDQRDGRLWLVLPSRGRPVAPAVGPADAAPDEAKGAWRSALAGAVAPASVDLSAVLARVSLPLAQVLDLSAGQSLVLPDQAVALVRLEAAGGLLVGIARLGAAGGHRALRLQALADGDAGPPPPPAPWPSRLVEAADQPLARAAAADSRPPSGERADGRPPAADGPSPAPVGTSGQGDTLPPGATLARSA